METVFWTSICLASLFVLYRATKFTFESRFQRDLGITSKALDAEEEAVTKRMTAYPPPPV